MYCLRVVRNIAYPTSAPDNGRWPKFTGSFFSVTMFLLCTYVYVCVCVRLFVCVCVYIYILIGIHYASIQKLQQVQIWAVHHVSQTNRYAHITPVSKALHWLPPIFQIHFKICLLTYKATHLLFLSTAPQNNTVECGAL